MINGIVASQSTTLPSLVVSITTSPYFAVIDTGSWSVSTIPTPSPINITAGAVFVRYNEDASRLFVGGNSGATQAYDTTTYVSDSSAINPAGSDYDAALFEAGTRALISHSTAPYLSLYDTSVVPFTLLGTHDKGITAPSLLVVSPDKSMVVMVRGSSVSVERVYATATMTAVAGSPVTAASWSMACFSPDGAYLFIKLINDVWKVYDTATWTDQAITFSGMPNTLSAVSSTAAWAASGWIYFISAGALYKLNTTTWAASSIATDAALYALAVDSSGTRLAVSGANTTSKGLRVFSAINHSVIAEISLSTYNAGNLEFAPA